MAWLIAQKGSGELVFSKRHVCQDPGFSEVRVELEKYYEDVKSPLEEVGRGFEFVSIFISLNKEGKGRSGGKVYVWACR